jgi:hypothetical protein
MASVDDGDVYYYVDLQVRVRRVLHHRTTERRFPPRIASAVSS